MSRKVYVEYDWFMLGKKEYGHGFANSKSVMFFESKVEAEKFLGETFDLSAKIVSRAVAAKYAENLDNFCMKGIEFRSLLSGMMLGIKSAKEVFFFKS